MANLDVQPKKKSSILPWILLALGILALLFFLFKGCGNNDTNATSSDTISAASPAPNNNGGWDDVDFNGPAVNYEEVTAKTVNVRGNNNYGVYGLGENVLFDEGKSEIRADAQPDLQQIVGSINKRYSGGDIRVYGFTDATGDASSNKQLAQQRAEAVRNWLVSNGKIDQGKVSLHAIGEAQPTATNATSEGRQQNRRVEIVVRVPQSGQ